MGNSSALPTKPSFCHPAIYKNVLQTQENFSLSRAIGELVQFSSCLQNSKLHAAFNQSHNCQFLPSSLRLGNSPAVSKPCCCPPKSLCPSLGGSREKPVPKLHRSCLPYTNDAGGRDGNDRELNLRNKREGNKAGKFNALMHSQPSARDATWREQTLSHFESRFLPWMWRRLENLRVIKGACSSDFQLIWEVWSVLRISRGTNSTIYYSKAAV